MSRVAFVVVAGAVVALFVNWAIARPQYNTEFKGKYYKPDGTDVEKTFAEKVDIVKCMVCHGLNAQGKADRRILNDYGSALGKLLNKQRNKQRIIAALDRVSKQKVPDGTDETFGDRIKVGKLPGGE